MRAAGLLGLQTNGNPETAPRLLQEVAGGARGSAGRRVLTLPPSFWIFRDAKNAMEDLSCARRVVSAPGLA